jgi:hypothetical protein
MGIAVKTIHVEDKHGSISKRMNIKLADVPNNNVRSSVAHYVELLSCRIFGSIGIARPHMHRES